MKIVVVLCPVKASAVCQVCLAKPHAWMPGRNPDVFTYNPDAERMLYVTSLIIDFASKNKLETSSMSVSYFWEH